MYDDDVDYGTTNVLDYGRPRERRWVGPTNNPATPCTKCGAQTFRWVEADGMWCCAACFPAPSRPR